MSLRKIGFLLLCITLGFISCDNDDDATITPIVELNREEQQKVDDSLIVDYLSKHYFNANAFDLANPDVKVTDLVITELPEGESVPDGHKLLINEVKDTTIVFEETNYKYYILKLRQGEGVNSPTFADDVRVHYEGFTLDNNPFDNNNLFTPTYFPLLGTITGWQKVFPNFNAAKNFTIENDGVVTYDKPGIGVMFLPSGLGYFLLSDNTPRNLHRRPLVFKFELLQVFESDVDGDGIPSYLEDLNGDGVFGILGNEDNTDEEGQPDINDNDDDNDGILTIDEIEIDFIEASTREELLNTTLASNQVLTNFIEVLEDGMGNVTGYKGKVITFTDTDGDGIPDYRDAN